MTMFRTELFPRDRASGLGRLIAVVLATSLLASACDVADPTPASAGGPTGSDTDPKTAALAVDGLHGFMIVSAGHPDLAVNAFGGAYDGGALKEYRGCWWENGACTWTYRDGRLLSDHDPSIGIRTSESPVEGELLQQSAGCSKASKLGLYPLSCMWTYRDGRFISAKDPSFAIYARGSHGADLVLNHHCLTSTSANCRWEIQRAMIGSVATGDRLMYTAWGGAFDGAPIRLADGCTRDNPACTWTFRNGMIISDDNVNTAMDVPGGVRLGRQIGLSFGCDTSNPACRWRLDHGVLYNDTSNLAVSPASLDNGADLFLRDDCTSNTCRVDMNVGGLQCGQRDQAPCADGRCAQFLTPVGGRCFDFFETTVRCPTTGSLHAGSVDGSVVVGFANDGTWGFKGHAHDGGPIGMNYTLGFTFNTPINGRKIGAVHSGVVHGTLDVGSRNDDFVIGGRDPALIDNWPALFSGGITCNMKSTANGWLIAENALIGLGLAAVGAVFVLVQATGDCNWQATPDGQGIERRCTIE